MSFQCQRLSFTGENTSIVPVQGRDGFVYYYDEDGKFKSEKVNWLQAMYYKTRKRKRIKYVCTECGNYFIAFVKSSNEELAMSLL